MEGARPLINIFAEAEDVDARLSCMFRVSR